MTKTRGYTPAGASPPVHSFSGLTHANPTRSVIPRPDSDGHPANARLLFRCRHRHHRFRGSWNRIRPTAICGNQHLILVDLTPASGDLSILRHPVEQRRPTATIQWQRPQGHVPQHHRPQLCPAARTKHWILFSTVTTSRCADRNACNHRKV